MLVNEVNEGIFGRVLHFAVVLCLAESHEFLSHEVIQIYLNGPCHAFLFHAVTIEIIMIIKDKRDKLTLRNQRS